MLRVFYHDESLMTVAARTEGAGRVSVEFCFPAYTRPREDMGHVSSVQIIAAILEGGYCALEGALLAGMFPSKVTAEWF